MAVVPRAELRRRGRSGCAPTTTPSSTSHACSIRASSRRCAMTEASVAEYADLEARRLGIQVAFALMFTVIALTLLMSSVLIGLNFANWLVAPIRRLMAAANLVSTGDLKVQVPVNKSEGDLANLGETFNKMTGELRTQRDDLVRASDVIDSRRRFIEAVLSSASAGIIGVERGGQDRHPQPLRRKTDRPSGIRGARPSAAGDRARTERDDGGRARGHAAAGAGADHHQPRRQGPEPVGARQRRAERTYAGQLHHHARRHHRACLGAAHVRLGRRRTAHRPRDQESADADPAFGGANPQKIRKSDRRGSSRIRPMYRHNRASGR